MASTTRGATLKRWLSSAWLRRGAILFSLLLVAPALRGGLLADDLYQSVVLRGGEGLAGLVRHPLDLFVFTTGKPELTAQLKHHGILPWWEPAHVELALFRPLASLSHWVDQLAWPDAPALMHAHSLAWHALLLVIVAAVYRSLASAAWCGGLALVLFALDDAHSTPVSWLANRYALMTVALALLALLAHDRWRRGGWVHGAWIGPLAFALALLASEAAVAIGGYLVAHALFVERAPRWRALVRLVPYGAVLVVWRVAYVAMGYGSAGMALYADPARDPLGFLAAVAERMPVLLSAQLFGPTADLWMFYPVGVARAVLAASVVALVVSAALLAPLLRRDALARFWLAGCVLALVPSCAVVPSDRILLLPGVGAMGLVARFLAARLEAVHEPGSRLRRVAARTLACVWIALHLVAAPLLLPLRCALFTGLERFFAWSVADVEDDAALVGKILVVVDPLTEVHQRYLQLYLTCGRHPRPDGVRSLVVGLAALELERVDERTLRVRCEEGFYPRVNESVLRGRTVESVVGERVDVPPMRVEVTALTADGRPAEALFRFDVPLEHPTLRFVHAPAGRMEPFELPAVGEVRKLPRRRPLDIWRAWRLAARASPG